MPKKTDREYRAMPLLSPGVSKRIDTEYYVEGFATTFGIPYVMFERDGIQYKEVVDRHALDHTDMSDVIFQYDHSGKIFARNKMGKNKPTTLILEPQDGGFFIAADLGLTEESKKLYKEIDEGLINEMSWSFIVLEDSYDRDTHTRTILKVKKVFDVSAVSIPANPSTYIQSRSWADGVIEREKQELLKRQKQIQKIKILTEVIK